MKKQWAMEPFVWGGVAVLVFFVAFFITAFFKSRNPAQQLQPSETPSISPAASILPIPTATPLPSGAKILEVRATPTGWLRVRKDPSATSEEVAQVNVGDRLISTEKKNGWYFVTLDGGVTGWVSGDYVKDIVE